MASNNMSITGNNEDEQHSEPIDATPDTTNSSQEGRSILPRESYAGQNMLETVVAAMEPRRRLIQETPPASRPTSNQQSLSQWSIQQQRENQQESGGSSARTMPMELQYL